jgi:hypothetical protein
MPLGLPHGHASRPETGALVSIPGAAPPDRRARVEGLTALGLGLGLIIAYARLVRGLANGRAEFGYAPIAPASLPWGAMRGFTWEQLLDHAFRLVVVGPALVLLSAAAYRLLPLDRVRRPDPRRLALAVATASTAATAFVMLVVLRGRAIVDDELTYQMQAGLYASGHLVARDVGYYPAGPFTVLAGGSYTGKYLFGEGLVQIVGRLIDRPALLHLPIAAIALYAFYCALRPSAGVRVAGWSTAFLAMSPMFVLTNATGQSQTTALACVSLAGLGHAWVRESRPRSGAALLAAALSFCAMTRPQTALPVAVVLLGSATWQLLRRREVVALLVLVAIGACGLAVIGAYDSAITGSPTTLPWSLQCNPERYGFGYVWRYLLYRHTLWTTLQNLLVVAVRFNAWWLGWPLGLSVIAIWWVVGRPCCGCGIWFAVGLAIILFEAGYYSTGISDTGPIYHFELLLPASVLVANTLLTALDRWPRAATATLAVHLALGTGSFFVVQIARIDRLVRAIHADADEALARISGRAVLLYETRGSEALHLGWVNADFPRQYRSDRDRVVTFPRPLRGRLAGLVAAYPDRSCWYYHRDSGTERPELLPCDQARQFLDRSDIDESSVRSLWVRSTAFKRASFDPFGDLARLKPKPPPRPCCAVEELRAAGGDPGDGPCDP